MKSLLVAATTVLVLTALPTAARAEPAPDLCTADGARGGVPADFVVDACVDATSVTLRNDLPDPVLVHRTGDLGTPVRVHQRGSSSASVLRLLSGEDELLMAGDVVRWPLGVAAATVSVAVVDPVTRSVVDTVTSRMPEMRSDDRKDTAAVAAVVPDVIAALTDRAACAQGKNFLRTASCDVDAAARISRALKAQLPRTTAIRLLPVVLDRARWSTWTAPAPPALDARPGSAAVATRQLSLAAVPPPVEASPPGVAPPPIVAPPPVVPAPPVIAPPSPAPVARPPAAPPVVAAVPRPAPAPAPTGKTDWQRWWGSVLQQLATRDAPTATGGGGGKPGGHGKGHH